MFGAIWALHIFPSSPVTPYLCLVSEKKEKDNVSFFGKEIIM